MIIDLHAHLDFDVFNDILYDILKNINFVVNPGSNYRSNFRILELFEKYDKIIPVLGVHPIDDLKINQKQRNEIFNLILNKNDKIFGIGEVGLDYHWDQNYDKQKENFLRWINLANNIKKPLIIHLRKPQAIDDGLEILEKHADVNIILHCWSGNITQTKRILENDNFYFSIATNSLQNLKKYKKLIKIIPLEKLFCETDSPYLWNEFPNKPENVKYVYELISNIKEIDIEEVKKNVYTRFFKIFNLQKKKKNSFIS